MSARGPRSSGARERAPGAAAGPGPPPTDPRPDPGEPVERPPPDARGVETPRLAFVGTGWIGLQRLRAVRDAGAAQVLSVVDPDETAARAALRAAPEARRHDSFEEALASGPDGVVIATPSSLHERQALAALRAGVPVFCQKPIALTAAGTERVARAARRRDLPLGVDFAYRRTAALRRMRALVAAEDPGRVYALRFVFHNAYGPDADWYYDPVRSGGGCVVDLGVHLVDLVLWLLDFPRVERVSSRLWAGGRPLRPALHDERGAAAPVDEDGGPAAAAAPDGHPSARDDGGGEVPYPAGDVRRLGRAEDHATVTLDLAGGVTARLACSWNLHADREAVVEGDVRGTDGSLAWRNVDGSFYDFTLERMRDGRAERLCSPPDDWPGRTLVGWARRVARGEGARRSGERLVEVARVVDRVYRAPGSGAPEEDVR